jgi:alginate O-acetyltransferase complex protein AlgI
MTVALGNWEWAPVHSALVVTLATLAIPLGLLEWLLQRRGDFFPLQTPVWLAYPAYATLIVICLAMSSHYQASFIYFQF